LAWTGNEKLIKKIGIDTRNNDRRSQVKLM